MVVVVVVLTSKQIIKFNAQSAMKVIIRAVVTPKYILLMHMSLCSVKSFQRK